MSTVLAEPVPPLTSGASGSHCHVRPFLPFGPLMPEQKEVGGDVLSYYMYTYYLLHVHLLLTTCTLTTYYMYTYYLLHEHLLLTT